MLPTGSNSFMTNRTEQGQRTADWLAGQRGFIDILHVDVFDPDVLAGALETLPPVYHGVAVIALDVQINDTEFADAATQTLLELIRTRVRC